MSIGACLSKNQVSRYEDPGVKELKEGVIEPATAKCTERLTMGLTGVNSAKSGEVQQTKTRLGSLTSHESMLPQGLVSGVSSELRRDC